MIIGCPFETSPFEFQTEGYVSWPFETVCVISNGQECLYIGLCTFHSKRSDLKCTVTLPKFQVKVNEKQVVKVSATYLHLFSTLSY